jgi:hypothetical protein
MTAARRATTTTYDSILIECVVTDDDPSGQCWPPSGLGDRWFLIRTVAGRSTWRRISLGHNEKGRRDEHDL